jgi:hypothetical protein
LRTPSASIRKDELRRLQPHGDLRCHLLDGEIEDFAGGRIADRRYQHDVAVVEPLRNGLGIDAADFAGELHVDAADDAHWLGREVVAARNAVARAGHRRVGETEREQRFDAGPDLAGGFQHAIHRIDVGDAHAVCVTAGNALRREDRLHLRPAAVADDQPDAQAVQQVEVVDDAQEFLVGNHFAAERNDERLASKRMHVGRSGANQMDERAHRRGIGGGLGVGSAWHRVRPGHRVRAIIAWGRRRVPARAGRRSPHWRNAASPPCTTPLSFAFRRSRHMASPLLEHLNPEQLAAVTLPHASALILAGAGSGKTRVLTTRIAWLLATGQAGPLSILAVTFTNKAAREMLLRLSALTPMNTRGMWVGTFHGLCNRMLRAHHRDANLPQLFQILDTQDQLSLIKRLYRAHNIDDDRYPPRQLQWFIANAKEEGLRANMVEAGDDFTRRQVEHYALYDEMCQREGVVDFAELLLRSYDLLAGNEALRGHYQRRFSHLLVDEFQDTNTLQYKWLRMLSGRAPPSSPWATTTSRSMHSAAPRSPTCSSSSATSPHPSNRSS